MGQGEDKGGVEEAMNVASAILLFGFLIFIHEFGHFVFAKLSGVKVLKFSLGFGPRLLGKTIGETEYVLSAIPLGGYVKMVGQEDVGEAEDIEGPDKERSFKNQSMIKRICIIFAGPFFNLLTAVVIFFFIFLLGMPTLLPTIGEVMPGSPAEKAILLKGDRIEQINGKPIKQWADMTAIIYESPDKPLVISIKRNTETITVTVTPEKKKTKDIFGEEREIGLIGVKPSGDTFIVRKNVLNSAGNAFAKTAEISYLTVLGVIKLIQRIIPAETIGGPVLIFQLAEKQAAAGVLSFFTFAAVISINLAILNLLPIPVLDGGHLLFMGIEAVRKKPLSDRAVMIGQRIGIAAILALMAFAMYNDIFRIISGKPIP